MVSTEEANFYRIKTIVESLGYKSTPGTNGVAGLCSFISGLSKKSSVMDTFAKWQQDRNKRSSGVYVNHFKLEPQTKGFKLHTEICLPGNSIEKTFYADRIEQCVDDALKFMKGIRETLISEIEKE